MNVMPNVESHEYLTLAVGHCGEKMAVLNPLTYYSCLTHMEHQAQQQREKKTSCNLAVLGVISFPWIHFSVAFTIVLHLIVLHFRCLLEDCDCY